MAAYRVIPVDGNKRFVSSKQHESILWLDNRKQLHYLDSKFQDYVLTSSLTQSHAGGNRPWSNFFV